jgi:hypothetical protein
MEIGVALLRQSPHDPGVVARGWRANRENVQRLMHQDKLPWLRKRRIIVTSDSDYGLSVYSTLARSAADGHLLASFASAEDYLKLWNDAARLTSAFLQLRADLN